MYGESKLNFVNILDELKLPYSLALRSNHALWLPQDQQVYQEPWQKFQRTFSRTWIEDGLKQAKEALGWADLELREREREGMTHYEQIEKWWELGMSALLRVSLFADAFNDGCPLADQQFTQHRWWNHQRGWKHRLNHLRLIIQALICFNWLKRWLAVFPIPPLQLGFEQLMYKMNQFTCPLVHRLNLQSIFSSA